MASKTTNVPESRQALDNMKFEIARQLGVNMKQGYNGDLTSRENGYVGGYMVKKMIEDYEKQAAGVKPQGGNW
ncbi:MAG: alpha/beta-type small acid-soluble spore protein [Eubacteriales bacterium]|nr:alpha/beta-type small acid-soluble spore protein [Eubacteriales bacterium]